MTSRKTLLLTLLAGLCAFGSVVSAGKKQLTFADVNTKYAANLALWWDRKAPVFPKIEKAHALGFEAIEFWAYGKEDIDAIAAKTKELGITVAQFTAWGKPLGSGKNIDEFEAGIKEAITVAHKLGAKRMTVTGHRWVEGYSLEEQLANYTKAMKRVAPLCEAADVMIIVEPFNPVDHGKNTLNGSQAAVKICREVNSPMIKINWDFYHMQLSEGALIHYLREGYDQVGYLQLADTPGRHQPGTGELNYKAILKAAYDLGYRGYVGVECRPQGTEAEALQQLLANSY
ncbi:MAG: hydroxypyruvate isomerase [Synoicihabitans sp.]